MQTGQVGLANRRIQPLCHLSAAFGFNSLSQSLCLPATLLLNSIAKKVALRKFQIA
jgi:hypothetical protein